MFGNSYEQTYSNWAIIEALQDKNNALCSENARLAHQLDVAKYQLQRVESVARNNVVLHRRELAKMAVESSAKSAVIANLSEAL